MWFVYLSCHVCCVFCVCLFVIVLGRGSCLNDFFFSIVILSFYCPCLTITIILYHCVMCVVVTYSLRAASVDQVFHGYIPCALSLYYLDFFSWFFFFIVVHVLLSLIFCTVWTARITFVDKLLHSDKVASSWDKTTIQQYRFSLHGAWSIVWMVQHSVFGHWWWLYLIELCVQTFGNGHCEC